MLELVFLLEEPSAKVLLQGVLPRLLPQHVKFRLITFEGKQDLEKGALRKLKTWRNPSARFVVLRDQDAGVCKVVKAKLIDICAPAHRDVLVRIACKELEAWILGDVAALSAEFGVPAALKQQNKKKYANPDVLARPVEEIRRLIGDYQKLDGAQRMGRRLDWHQNSSPSFKAFCQGVLRVTRKP